MAEKKKVAVKTKKVTKKPAAKEVVKKAPTKPKTAATKNAESSARKKVQTAEGLKRVMRKTILEKKKK